MTITLPLQPQEEARLVAAAQAKGVSTDALVREAIDKILADAIARHSTTIHIPSRMDRVDARINKILNPPRAGSMGEALSRKRHPTQTVAQLTALGCYAVSGERDPVCRVNPSDRYTF